MNSCRIINLTRDTIIAHRAEWARSFWTRLRGLMLHNHLLDGSGLVLEPNNSVHTFGMRFVIDVIFVDRSNTVVGVVPAMLPNRPFAGARQAYRTIEVPQGVVAKTQTRVGDRLVFEDV